jgi:glutathione S-transferase
MSMILRSAGPSPFGRKVKIAAMVAGLMDDITVELADTLDANDTLRMQNPLGKLPCLLLADGTAIYDSRVIVAYLDELSGGKLIPTGAARIPALRLEALSDGIKDAGILQVYEKRFRPEEVWHQPWLDYQAAKISRALSALESGKAGPLPDPAATPHVGAIALACALGYLDFRFDGTWRREHPELVVWHGRFDEAHEAYGKTAPDA